MLVLSPGRAIRGWCFTLRRRPPRHPRRFEYRPCKLLPAPRPAPGKRTRPDWCGAVLAVNRLDRVLIAWATPHCKHTAIRRRQ